MKAILLAIFLSVILCVPEMVAAPTIRMATIAALYNRSVRSAVCGGGPFTNLTSIVWSTDTNNAVSSGVDITGATAITVSVTKTNGSPNISDSAGNVFTPQLSPTLTGAWPAHQIYVCANPTHITNSDIFTITGGGSGLATIWGSGGTVTVVGSSESANTNITTIQPGSLSASTNTLFYASASYEHDETLSANSSFAYISNIGNGSGGGTHQNSGVVGYYKQSTNSENPTLTVGTTAQSSYAGMIQLVTCGGGGGGGGGGGSPLIASSLIAYYKFDDNSGTSATDSSGNSHTATLSGATKPAWSTPYIGVASLSFNGSTAYVLGDSTTATDPGAGSYSVMAWFKTTSATSQYLFSKAGGNGTFVRFFITSGGAVAANVQGEHGSQCNPVNNSQNWADGNWHLAILKIDGSNQSAIPCSISVDGTTYVTDGANTVGPIDPGGALSIGNNGGSGGNSYFNGNIDEVGVYSRVLTPTEATTLYGQSHP